MTASIQVSGWIEKATPPLYRVCSEIRDGERVYARGEAKFMRMRRD